MDAQPSPSRPGPQPEAAVPRGGWGVGEKVPPLLGVAYLLP